MKKTFLLTTIFFFVFTLLSPVAFSDAPKSGEKVSEITSDESTNLNKDLNKRTEILDDRSADFDGIIPSSGSNRYFSQKFKSGEIALTDIPLVIIKLTDLVTKLAGTICVLFLLYGGFQLMLSGMTDDKEQAKNTIQYALIGLAVSFLAWVIVYVIQAQLTGGV